MFAGQLAKAQGDIAHALTQSLLQLDRDFLECEAYTEIVRTGSLCHNKDLGRIFVFRNVTARARDIRIVQVRAGSGADISVAIIDTQTLVVHLASVGRCNAILGELQHGLAQQVSEAAFLFPYAGDAPAPIGMGMRRDQRLAGALAFKCLKPYGWTV